MGQPGLIIQAKRRPLLLSGDKETARFGFTASKKVGNAIARNKAKRRLRVLVRQFANQVDQNLDFVLIARHSTVDYDLQVDQRNKASFQKVTGTY